MHNVVCIEAGILVLQDIGYYDHLIINKKGSQWPELNCEEINNHYSDKPLGNVENYNQSIVGKEILNNFLNDDPM